MKVNVYWLKNYIFNSTLLPKVIHRFVSGGNKETIEKAFYLYFKILRKVTVKPVFLILNIIQNSYPGIGLRSTRSRGVGVPGGKKGLVRIYIPFPIKQVRGLKIGLKWFKFSVLKQPDSDSSLGFIECLLKETLAYYTSSSTSKIRDVRAAYYEQVHDNRLAIHFR